MTRYGDGGTIKADAQTFIQRQIASAIPWYDLYAVSIRALRKDYPNLAREVK